MSNVPPEVIYEIFLCLPVKSLLRFRCVSKPFLTLIDSTDFIESHLNRTLRSTSQRNIIVRSYSDFYSLDLDSLDNPYSLNQPGKSPYIDTEVLGHSNGLLCLLIGANIFLWNPWTRVHNKLPVTEIKFEFSNNFGYIDFPRIVYGFGYDGVNDDYKVVRVIQFLGDLENEVKVYSVKLDSWRRVKDFPYFLRFTSAHGVLVSGALHWVVTRGDHLIASFDIATEEYHLIPQPQYVEMGSDMIVGEVGGKLTVLCNYDAIYMDVWVMNNYGVRESWTKLLSVAQSIDPSRFKYLRPIAYLNDGEKVLFVEQDGRKLLWYDLKLKILKAIRIDDVPQIFDAFVCMQSLVKLPRSDCCKWSHMRKRRQQKKTQQER